MNEIFYNYILQAVLGSAAGYITNDYAINMLFKEYTPLKIGGVIKKTRNEFIDNLSSLVENDIVNKEKLINILTDDEFKSKFEQLTEDFFKNCLYEVSGKDTFANIKGIDSTITTIGEFFEKYIQEHMNDLTEILFRDANLNDFLNEKQVNKIVDSLFESVCETLKNTNIIEEELNYLYSKKGNVKTSEFISTNNVNIFSDNIILKLNELIKNDSTKIEEQLKDIFNSIEFDKTFSSTKNSFYEKTLGEIIKIDDEFRIKATNLCLNYLNSHAGQNTIYDLCDSLFSYIKNSNKTLFDIVDSSFEINLKTYLSDNLPQITESIVNWVRQNNNEINKLIEDSVNEVIKEADPLKGKLLNTLKNTYLNNISEKYNIVQKIIKYIQQETEPEKLSVNISSKIIDYLSAASIGEILTAAENNKVISPLKASDFITSYLNDSFKSIIDEFINKILSLKIKDILPQELYATEIIKNKIISSSLINKYLSKRANTLAGNYLNKNLNELISNDNLNNFIPSLKKFINRSLNKNKSTITKLFKEELYVNINSINLYDILNKNTNISDLIKEKIINEFKIMSNEIKNSKLSSVFDKINEIDNLNKNSSEMLRKLIINNMDTILSGSIKAIVLENLNKLSDDELVDFANDFIGRELQPIMYFGGILGLIVGIILAMIQNSPPNLGKITLANMFTCALVGLLTNVIAIDMIFKPYKENKLLSKIPFLRNFSLGYIVKNKNVFAKNTAHFVDNQLLRRDSINKLFDKYENNIKLSLTKGVSENDYYVMHKLLTNNENNIISGTYEFTKNLINKNINFISGFFVNKTDEYDLSSLLSPASINHLCSLGLKNQHNINNNLSDFAFSYLNSEKLIKNQIPNSFVDYTKSKINNVSEIYYVKTANNLEDMTYVKDFILQYNEKYKNILDKDLNEIFKHEEIKLFGSIISQKISDIILSEISRKNIIEKMSKLIEKYVVGDKTFGEIFNGKLKGYFDLKMPTLLEKLSSSIKSSIIKSKPVISINVQNEIKNSLGLLERGMFSIMGGGDIVDELVHKIMVVKLPEFIDSKKLELDHIFNSSINDSFYNKKVNEFSNSINKEQINNIIDSYFSDGENVEFINRKINFTVDNIVKKSETINVKNVLKYFSLDDLNNFIISYEVELSKLLNDLSKSMVENKNLVLEKINAMTNEVIENFINTFSFKDLSNEITKEDVKTIMENLLNILNKDNFSKDSLEKFIYNYKDYSKDKKTSEFIDKEDFKISTESFIKNKVINNKKEDSIKKLYGSLLNDAVNSNFSFIHEETKTYALNLFVESSLKSIRRNLDKILKAVKFDKIAQEEIEAMEPKKIHEMFNSFMGKYFTRLKIYGVWGFVFGINVYIGLTLTILKFIGETFNKFKNKK